MQYHLAQLNIARMKGEIDSPVMASFVARLDEINALAEFSPGFVWRLKTEAGDATSIQLYEDDRIIVNFSVWEDLGSLREFVYRTMHGAVMRQRRDWFERMEDFYYVLWWVPAGSIPSLEAAKERLEYLRVHRETAYAFTFADPKPSPEISIDIDLSGVRDGCPA
ncbi:MAG: DUF3291 domain-containing protein [Anaerolineae bacterium]|nr:DUF3291 domain-containing protein [Gloeobacterales cyanobacterium ES-bin-313]